MTCALPIDIVNDENIVRLIRTPQHINKNNMLKPSAFRSKVGTDDVSVIRHTHMGTDFCKSKAKKIMTTDYVGLAVVSAGNIRDAGSKVRDSREEFCGHASIMHGVMILQSDEPPTSQDNLLITERCKRILEYTKYYPDPAPQLDCWTGPNF